MKLSFLADVNSAADTVVFPVFKGQELKGTLESLDSQTGGLIAQHYNASKHFKFKLGQTLVLQLILLL